MADLPTLADRLNDIEISANAPVTETLMRRIGSNINFLLDFLGVTDGSSTTSGDLSDLVNALSIAGSNSYDLQTTFVADVAKTVNVGSFPSVKYLDQIFYLRAPININYQDFNLGNTGPTSRFFTEINIDGSGYFVPEGPVGYNPSRDIFDVGFQQTSPDANKYKGSMVLNYGSGGQTANFTKAFLKLDWRDGDDIDVRVFSTGQLANPTVEIWRGYRLNVASFPISF